MIREAEENEAYYRSLIAKPGAPIRSRSLTRSLQLKEKALSLIPSGTQTFSKGPTQFVQGVSPVFLDRGNGSRVWDVDGNEYLDLSMALGSVILGHAYPAVMEAVERQMRKGTNFSLPHPLEVEVSERLAEIVPCAEMIRFGKNGSDATSGAVRLARACTGREIVACCGYHGWQDWYIGTTSRKKGVPEAVCRLTRTFSYNNLKSLEQIFSDYPGQVACVILEPVGVVEPESGFLKKVCELARREGALVIFDEVVTGFRMALGGAQERFGVVPDLACLGKGMANGFPLSAVVGKREIMSLFDEVFFSFTFGGEDVSLAASLATLAELRSRDVIAHLWRQGERLRDGFNVLAKSFGLAGQTRCVGLPPRTVVEFKDEKGNEDLVHKSLFQQECVKRGVLFTGGHNLSLAHGNEDIEYTLWVYRTALEILSQAIKSGSAARQLEGEPVSPIFRQP